MITHKYNNPPLVEAVFELFYHPSKWNPALPGLFYDKVQEKYPEISQNRGGIGFNIGGQGIQIGKGSHELIRYQNAEKNDIIQLSSNLFSVNRLPKYNNWENFSKTILENTKKFNDVIEPKIINRLGLKTLNKLDLGKEKTLENVTKLFETYPVINYPKRNEINSINFTFEIPVGDGEICSVMVATLVSEPGMENPVIFQIAYTRVKPILINEIEAWLEKAHTVLNETFEKNLTEFCKEKFK